MRSIVTPSLLALSIATTAPLAGATARVVEIHVIDQQAKALPGVAVTLAAEPQGDYRDTGTTDGSGVVTFTVPDGKKSYRIEAAAPELAPFAEVVDLGKRKLPRDESVRLEITLTPPTAADHFNRGVEALRNGDTAAGEAAMRSAVEVDPNLARAWEVLALISLQSKRYGEALDAADRALALTPAETGALRSRYEALAGLKRDAEADAALDELLKTDHSPELARLLFNAGAVAGNAGDLELARRRLGQALEREPGLWQVHTALAELDVREQHLDQAVAELDKALALAPQQRRVWQRKIELLKALGREDEAASAEKSLAELGGAG